MFDVFHLGTVERVEQEAQVAKILNSTISMSSELYLSKVRIENFKCFEVFSLNLTNGTNILVGDNEAGKSTIIEAIHLALTGLYHGRSVKTELNEFLFNRNAVQQYLDATNQDLPRILIELYFSGEDFALFEGDGSYAKGKEQGFALKIEFKEDHRGSYEALKNAGEIKSLPIEYYDVVWRSFARYNIITRNIPIKSALIDSSSNRFQNGLDIYMSRIVRDYLNDDERVSISQAYRKMKESFMDDPSVQEISTKIGDAAKVSDKTVSLSIDHSSHSSWENALTTYLDDIPFHNSGKGEQCRVKTKLALSHKKSEQANVLLLEEPENHLSHSKLNKLLEEIQRWIGEKQLIISTHSSFVANKLGLGNLNLIANSSSVKFDDLSPETKNFFSKIAGYDTLRLLLCEKAILVEGPSDELVVQKAFRLKNEGSLPIQKEVDVISVGTSFLRFLEIAKKIGILVTVVTDNDGNVQALKDKFADYLGENAVDNISICFSEVENTKRPTGLESDFNINTLEPNMLFANSLESMNKALGTDYINEADLLKYMRLNKTECALKVYETNEELTFPKYILDAIAIQ